jgi:thioredoxin 1
MSQRVIKLAADAVQSVIEQTVVPVMIDFGTPWCAPCRQQQPITRQVARRMGRAAKVCAVDIDGNRPLAAHLNIHSIPTLIIFAAAVERERFIGVQSAERLVATLNRWVARLALAETESRDA